MDRTAVKTDIPSHLEDLGQGKDELDQHVSSVGPPRTTLYQVVFSMFIGVSGWMYNFDLG